MKKIVLFLSLFAALGLATNSCISKMVEPDVIPTPPPSKDKDIFFIRIGLGLVTGSSFALDWSTYNRLGFFVEESNGNMAFTNKEIVVNKESGNEDLLLYD